MAAHFFQSHARHNAVLKIADEHLAREGAKTIARDDSDAAG